ncbi:MAG: amidohydrolase family protein [Candidatus Magasanikbacteria bacterium]|nr:amidohydrolase family protein [Candidatus Magasanikbacteria bacterium]
MIIDIHAHTSNRVLWGLHSSKANLVTLEKEAEEYGVIYTVLLATHFPYKGTGLHNMELLERIQERWPRRLSQFRVFGSLDVMNDFQGGLEELHSLAKSRVIFGIKLYPGYQNFNPSDPNVFPVYELAQEFGLPVMFHTGELHHCCPKEKREKGQGKCGSVCWVDRLGFLAEPKQMEGAIKNFPRTKFILAHLGNPYFEQTRILMRRYSNVFTDTSGQFVSGTAEDTLEYRAVLKKELEKFLMIPGAENRIMFGTDFPIQSYADAIALVKSLGLPQETEEKIFFRNAARLLKIIF